MIIGWVGLANKSKISCIGYINRVRDNILSIPKKSLTPLFDDLKAADCVVCGGSGRSLYSLNAAMSQIALSQVGWRNKVILTPDDPGFPGKNMYDAAMDLERRYKKILLLMNSGSGYSDDPSGHGTGFGKIHRRQEDQQIPNGLADQCFTFTTC